MRLWVRAGVPAATQSLQAPILKRTIYSAFIYDYYVKVPSTLPLDSKYNRLLTFQGLSMRAWQCWSKTKMARRAFSRDLCNKCKCDWPLTFQKFLNFAELVKISRDLCSEYRKPLTFQKICRAGRNGKTSRLPGPNRGPSSSSSSSSS